MKHIVVCSAVVWVRSGILPLFAFSGEPELGYFPLFVPSQQQVLQEKIYVQEYESQSGEPSVLLRSNENLETNNIKKQSVPLVLPPSIQFQLPESLPETGGDI